MRALITGKAALLGEAAGVLACSGCGLCTNFACEMGLTPSEVMTMLKNELGKAGIRPKPEENIRPDPWIAHKAVPVRRLIARMRLVAYDQPAPYSGKTARPASVRIMLRQHVGRPAEPVVRLGDAVTKGQLIAQIPENALGAMVHASIDGRVSEMTEEYIVLRREYMKYYLICALFGGRKQIMFVYSPWVLIELLGFRADSMSLLAISGALIGIFFVPVVGKLIDRFGTRKIMMIEAVAFVSVYIAYGGVSRWANAGIQTGHTVALAGVGMLLVFLLNIVDRMSAQFAMVRSLYMQSIAVRREDVTPSLTAGMAIDHIVAIVGSLVCGAIWYKWGPEYVFVVAGLFSLANLFVAMSIKPHHTINEK
jgi:hypothetical protein